MKILVIGFDNIEQRSLDNFLYSTSYNHIQALRRAGVEVVVDDTLFHYVLGQSGRGSIKQLAPVGLSEQSLLKHINTIPSNYDHIIATGLMNFSHLPQSVRNRLRTKIRSGGKICEFNDCVSSLGVKQASDVVFVSQRSTVTSSASTHYVGWAADTEVFIPNQDPTNFTVFVDHPLYVESIFDLYDRTHWVLHQLQTLSDAVQRSNFATVTVKRLTNQGLAIVDLSKPIDTKADVFNDAHLPYLDYAAELSTSHIFIPTHPESLGLSVLEAGMAGCLVVSHPGFIPEDRLSTVDHRIVDFDPSNRVNWADIIASIDVSRTRATAFNNNWTELTNRVLEYLRV